MNFLKARVSPPCVAYFQLMPVSDSKGANAGGSDLEELGRSEKSSWKSRSSVSVDMIEARVGVEEPLTFLEV